MQYLILKCQRFLPLNLGIFFVNAYQLQVILCCKLLQQFSSYYFHTLAKPVFSGEYWNRPVCPSVCQSVCLSVYKILVSIKALAGVLSHIYTVWISIQQYRNLKPLEKGLLITLWEKEKMLATSICSFFPQCFVPYQSKIVPFLATLRLSSANAFNLDINFKFVTLVKV